jgi:class 3 adenylate cyclase
MDAAYSMPRPSIGVGRPTSGARYPRGRYDQHRPEKDGTLEQQLREEHGGTLEHFAGDGLMVFFNDPVPQPDHVARAVRMAIAMRERFGPLAARWAKLGFELGLGVGIATGYATLGRIGFEGRYDYGMVGAAVIIASRLSSAAEANQILLNPRANAAVDELVEIEEVGALTLKGFARPIPTVNVVGLRSPAPVS